jgi:alkanesulfonate monooxygenase
MMDDTSPASIEVFSTCPASNLVAQPAYMRTAIDVARWSEEHGCKGILVYTDNSLIDPWLVSQIIIEHTKTLCPLVAVQPVYMHPYTVAKMLASFGHLYSRRLYLNMVAGGFKNDLGALNDTTPHDKRYERLKEYTFIIQRLLAGQVVTHEGEFYKVERLKMTPPLAADLQPGVLVSGSSEAGLEAARSLGATAVEYPRPVTDYETGAARVSGDAGIRVGIIARDDEEDAWQIARRRFPEDRAGQLAHQVAMKVSDSHWHKQLSAKRETTGQNPYWLVPFQNYKTFCPYLVGSYARVGEELARYVSAGYHTFILDVPPNAEEMGHIGLAFQRALAHSVR